MRLAEEHERSTRSASQHQCAAVRLLWLFGVFSQSTATTAEQTNKMLKPPAKPETRSFDPEVDAALAGRAFFSIATPIVGLQRVPYRPHLSSGQRHFSRVV